MPGENPRPAGPAVSGGDHDASDPGSAQSMSPFARRTRRLLWGAALVILSPAAAATTADAALAATGPMSVGLLEIVQLAVSIGVVGAALLSAVWLIRERRSTFEENALLRGKIADLGAALQRSEAMLNLRDQRVIVWSSEHKKPELVGTLPLESGAPDDRSAFLAFGRWLTPRSAAALDHAIMALRERSVAFDLTVEAAMGAALEVQGR